MKHDAFLGDWQISRQIEDDLSGTARFVGVASLSVGAPWIYSETGQLTLPTGASFVADRRYLWQPVDDGFDVAFSDGREFHRLRFDVPQAAHWCDPDQYDVAYEFSRWPQWQSTWTVRGPRKSYRMTSLYRR